jgi:hypothetical protein
MNTQILFRNPKSGLTEVREFSEKAPYQSWVKTLDGQGNKKIELKEFAADSQLGFLRIADPILTKNSQGYPRQMGFIGDELFPSLRMQKESGRFPAWGKEALVIPSNLKRGVGQRVALMTNQTGWVTMALDEYAEGFPVENREVNEWAGSSDQLLNGRQSIVDSHIALVREQIQMTLATTASGYDTGFSLSGASKAWASSGDATKDMLQLIALVQKNNIQRPQIVWFTPTGWYLFTNNPSVFEKIKYGGEPAAPAQLYVGGQEAVARLLGVEKVVVAWASYAYGTPGGFLQTTGTVDWLWESVNGACAGCVIRGQGWMVPAFGYTYERENSPIVESWYSNETKSMRYDTEHFFASAITKKNAGGLYYSLA